MRSRRNFFFLLLYVIFKQNMASNNTLIKGFTLSLLILNVEQRSCEYQFLYSVVGPDNKTSKLS